MQFSLARGTELKLEGYKKLERIKRKGKPMKITQKTPRNCSLMCEGRARQKELENLV